MFLFIAALLGGFAVAVYVPVIRYMNLTRLPESARLGWVNIIFRGCKNRRGTSNVG